MCFSEDAIWTQQTTSGFRQQVFVMYHSTKSAQFAESILANGFKHSNTTDKMLGAGIYVSKTIEKAEPYGPITFKMLVYTGMVCRVDRQGHPMQTAWRESHGSAWVPPKCGMVPSGLEENCVKSTDQVKILGVVRGWPLLSPSARTLTRDLAQPTGACSAVDPRQEMEVCEELDRFLGKLGLLYSKLQDVTRNIFMADPGHRYGEPAWHTRVGNGDGDSFLWTRSWDNCLENKSTGRVLTFDSGRLTLTPYGGGCRSQKWRLDSAGALLNKATKGPLVVEDIGYGFKPRMGRRGPYPGDFDVFKFHGTEIYGSGDYYYDYHSDSDEL